MKFEMPKDVIVPDMKPYKPEEEDNAKKRRSKVHTPDVIPPIPIVVPPMWKEMDKDDNRLT